MAFTFFQRKKQEDPHLNVLGKHVLLCEGDAFYAEAIQVLLNKNGYIVEKTNDPAQVIPLLGAQHFDLILCAIDLPSSDGFAVLKSVAVDPNLKRIPFIFLTTVSSIESIDRAREAGATDYFIKATAGLVHLLELIKKYV